MTKTMSIYLDFLRISSALLVAYGHLTQAFFSSETKDQTYLATVAVGVFFVLSGYVIRYVAEEKERDFLTYTVARLARIYSVLVPALILSVLVAVIVGYVNPIYYENWSGFSSYPLLRVVSCLLFLNQSYGIDISPFSNSPVWSLGYEVPYYFVFGICFFLNGWLRMALLLGMMALLGPNIFVLFLPWLLGAWLYGYLGNAPVSRRAGLCCLAAAVVIAVLYVRGVHANIEAMRAVMEQEAWFLRDRYSPHFPTFLAVGMLVGLSIVAVRAFDTEIGVVLVPLARPIRGMASSTFSIYLYHFPILVLIYAVTGYDRSSQLARMLVFSGTVGACFLLSRVTEARKAVWGRWIDHALRTPRRFRWI